MTGSDELERKEACLRARLADLGSALVAYSGGTDSTLLLAVAREVLGDRVRALVAVSPVYAEVETRRARELCARLQVPFRLSPSHVLDDPAFAANPPDRCYRCKTALAAQCRREAAEHGLAHVLDGTNADDHLDYRPGLRAAAEGGIVSPLAECGLSKAEVRELSRRRGLPTWDRPAMACLASRFPYGTEITAERLARVAACEEVLRAEGFRQARVRFHGEVARIEVSPEEVARFADAGLRERVDAAFRARGFAYAALDLRGYRTGSLNETLPARAPGLEGGEE